jgi:hypothetical protein
MHNKIMKTAKLLAQYEATIGEVELAQSALSGAMHEAWEVRQELLKLMPEAELDDIMQTEPTDVPNPAGGGEAFGDPRF